MFRIYEKDIRRGVLVGLSSVLLAIVALQTQGNTVSPTAPELRQSTSSIPAIVAPGWVSAVAERVSPEEALQLLGATSNELEGDAPLPSARAAYATPGDYAELAEALENDPLRIYQYVRNHFEYVPYFGFLKGPYLTLHERSGNDFDQSALLIELLRAANISARFQFGTVTVSSVVDVQAVANWLGTDADLELIAQTFAQGGVPVALTDSSVSFNHVWVEATINQQAVLLDPAFKPSTRYSSIDLTAAMKYTEAGVLAAADGVQTGISISGMKLDALGDYLEQRATNLQNYLKSHHPNDRVEDVLGGFKIVQDNSENLPASLPLAVIGTPLVWDTVPANYMHTLRLRHGGIDITRNISDIAGRKVSLLYRAGSTDFPSPLNGATDYGSLPIDVAGGTQVWDGINGTGLTFQVVPSISGPNASAFEITIGKGPHTIAAGAPYSVGVRFAGIGQSPGRKNVKLSIKYYYRGKPVDEEIYDLTGVVASERIAKLFIDDRLEAYEDIASGDQNNLQLIINHPYAAFGGTFADQSRDFPVKRTGAYVIVSAFGGDKSSTLLSERQRILNRMSVDGTAANAPRRLTETLNVIGQTWMQQTQLNSDLLYALSGKRNIRHHRFGIVGQEAGYFVDMAAQLSSTSDRMATTEQGAFKTQSFIASAMEHSVLDQLQGINGAQGLTNPAVSTIRLLALTNWKGERLFVANKNNYDNIAPQLRNYSSDTLAEFRLQTNASHTLMIPEEGAIPLMGWTGHGYVDSWDSSEGRSIGMIIGGGLNGGKSTKSGTASTGIVRRDYLPEISLRKNVPITPAGDPVDLGTGAFISSVTDFGVAGSGTRGFALTRSYNSQMASQDTAGLGRGWTHNYNIYLSKHSDVEAALGERTVFDAIPMVVVNEISRRLLQANVPTAMQWGVAAMVANWGMDQLLNKSVTVQMGSQALTYQEMPNGEFMPPAGVTTKLMRTGNLFKLHERSGTTWMFDSDDRIASIKDVDGNVMTFSYNGDGKLTRVEDAHSRKLFFQYTNDKLVRSYDSTFHQVTYNQTDGDLTNVSGLQAVNWTYGYDNLHRLKTVKNPVDVQIVDNTYNDFDRVVEQRAPRDTGIEIYKLHYSGFMSAEEDPEGNRTTYHFDLDGRRVAIKDALGNTARIEYDGQGHAIKQTDPRGFSSISVYDGDNNLKEQINDNGNKITFSYDAQHRLKETRDPLNHKANFDYDAKHHLIEQRDHYGRKVKTTYLPTGLVDTVTDPRGTETELSYDANGYISTAQTGSHPKVIWNYSTRGELQRLVDQKGAMTWFTYDNRGLVKKRIDAQGKTTGNNYTKAGKLATSTDRNDNLTFFTYTDSGKLNLILSSALAVDFNYDSRDNLVEMIDSSGTTRGTHDVVGRLTSHTDSNGHTVGYEYDAAGNVTTLTYPPGFRKVKYTYDNLNRLSTVTIDWLAGKPTMRYVYDDASRLDRIEHFNAMKTDYSWDDTDRLTGIAHAGSSTLVDYSFLLDDNGNRKRETISPAPITLGSLVTDDTSFSYNIQRNRLKSTSKHAYAYGTEGELVGTLDAVASRYSYDNEGQLVGKDAVDYTFDSVHRLVQRGSDSFVYDGVGNRLKATRDGLETQYVYDAAGNLLAETNSAGQPTRYYIYGVGLAAMVKSSTYYVYHFDGTGHTVALTDANNTVVNKYTYSPYGKVLGQVQAFNQPFKYAGQVGIFTESDNIYYMRARYYDAETGRFISEDPAGFIGGLNLYSYVGGDPVNAVDPTGLIKWTGTATTISATAPVGATLTRYTLISEVVEGASATVNVTAVGPSLGYGVTLSGSKSRVAVQDSLNFINPNVFNGSYEAIQAGVTVPFGPGYGFFAVNMGAAGSAGHGFIDIGYDAGITGTKGAAAVTSITWNAINRSNNSKPLTGRSGKGK